MKRQDAESRTAKQRFDRIFSAFQISSCSEFGNEFGLIDWSFIIFHSIFVAVYAITMGSFLPICCERFSVTIIFQLVFRIAVALKNLKSTELLPVRLTTTVLVIVFVHCQPVKCQQAMKVISKIIQISLVLVSIYISSLLSVLFDCLCLFCTIF